MHELRVKPSGVALVLEEGETMLMAARRLGYRWPSVCGGNAQCTTCYVKVLEGVEYLSAMTPLEERGAALLRLSFPDTAATVRLACQTSITGDVVVRKTGVRPAG